MLRALAVLAWICLALDAILVVAMFVTRNVGDDAAGYGVATIYGLALNPILLGTATLLWWATRHGSRAGLMAGALIAGIPFIALAANRAGNLLDRIDHARYRATLGQFTDPALTELARAIDRNDADSVRTLLASGPHGWTQRDRQGRTLLGHAVAGALDSYGDSARIATVATLLDNGVPYASNAIEDDPDWFATMATRPDARYDPAIASALAHGANPNVSVPSSDEPLIMSTSMTPARLELFAAHGADLDARLTREDRPGWSALMNAITFQMWPVATWLLAHGASPRYAARDGKTAKHVLDDVAARERQMGTTPSAAQIAFGAALGDALGMSAAKR